MIQRGVMALVGQKSLHWKQATHRCCRNGSAVFLAIRNTPMEQRSTQMPHPLQKMRSTVTSIRIVGEGLTSNGIRHGSCYPAGSYTIRCPGSGPRPGRVSGLE